MTSEEWRKVKEVLQTALELDPEARAGFLDSACPPESSLRSEVESLLRSHDEDKVSLEQPVAINPANLLVTTSPATWIGRRLGPYKLLEQVGEGGMGAVYRAVRADGLYDKQVAVKLIRSGLGTDFFVARFRNERQILAGLEHPNIARLSDGGVTEEGLPYVVLEFVAGMPIDEYCACHDLPIANRLKLFRTVCSAVQYAHQNLVVHRDLKPGNILVTEDGVPKLLDFGIAKILGPAEERTEGDRTLTVMRVMTPDFASPEQVRGDPITTASDVYSLGVILYVLLTGRRPFRIPGIAPHEIIKAICDTDPEKPSTAVTRLEKSADSNNVVSPVRAGEQRGPDPKREKLRRVLSGDLDNIVLKALRKEPARRYATVEQFSEDVRRHLEHLPVIARKDTPTYRTAKFISRHRVGVALTALVIVALLTATGVTLRQARIARAERARAERRFNDVRALANSLMFEIHDGISRLPGSTPVRELLVNRALQYLDSLSKEASGDPSLQRELAAAYDRVGDLQGNTSFANQGKSSDALQSYRRALTIRESLAATRPDDLNLQTELSDEYFRMANSLEAIGDFAGSLAVLHKALLITGRIAAGTNDPKIRDRQAGSYYFIASLLNETGDSTGALENYRTAAAIHQAITTTDQRENMNIRTHLAGDYAGMAQVMMVTGDFNQALQEQDKALQILKELSSANPMDAALREFLAESYNMSGTLRKQLGDQPRALEGYRQAREIFKELVTADPANFLARDNFGFSADSIGEILVSSGDISGGLQYIREGLAAFEAMANAGSKDRYVQSGLAQSYYALGSAYLALAANANGSVAHKTRRWREARAWYQKSSDIWVEKRTHGSLDRLDRQTAERTAQGIAKCDAALARLGTPPQ